MPTTRQRRVVASICAVYASEHALLAPLKWEFLELCEWLLAPWIGTGRICCGTGFRVSMLRECYKRKSGRRFLLLDQYLEFLPNPSSIGATDMRQGLNVAGEVGGEVFIQTMQARCLPACRPIRGAIVPSLCNRFRRKALRSRLRDSCPSGS